MKFISLICGNHQCIITQHVNRWDKRLGKIRCCLWSCVLTTAKSLQLKQTTTRINRKLSQIFNLTGAPSPPGGCTRVIDLIHHGFGHNRQISYTRCKVLVNAVKNKQGNKLTAYSVIAKNTLCTGTVPLHTIKNATPDPMFCKFECHNYYKQLHKNQSRIPTKL